MRALVWMLLCGAFLLSLPHASAEACTVDADCDAGDICCGAGANRECVDPDHDEEHCGGCFNSCETYAGEYCVLGTCGCGPNEQYCNYFATISPAPDNVCTFFPNDACISYRCPESEEEQDCDVAWDPWGGPGVLSCVATIESYGEGESCNRKYCILDEFCSAEGECGGGSVVRTDCAVPADTCRHSDPGVIRDYTGAYCSVPLDRCVSTYTDIPCGPGEVCMMQIPHVDCPATGRCPRPYQYMVCTPGTPDSCPGLGTPSPVCIDCAAYPPPVPWYIQQYCSNCDGDGDGHDRIGGTCGGDDCNDNDPGIHPGINEAGSLCIDGWDNDCDDRADYDGYTYDPVSGTSLVIENEGEQMLGDTTCPVGVVPPPLQDWAGACEDSDVTITCASSVDNVISIVADIDGQPCTPRRWVSQGTYPVREFTCDRGAAEDQDAIATCRVDTSISTARTDAPYAASSSDGFYVSCIGYLAGTVNGNGHGLDDATVRIPDFSDTGYTTDSIGAYTVANLPVGQYLVTASAPGYDPAIVDPLIIRGSPDPITGAEVPGVPDETRYDFTLLPEECTPTCALGGECDYRCIDEGMCVWDPTISDPADRAEVRYQCESQPQGTLRDISGGREVVCCNGPIRSTAASKTPFLISSCAEHQVPMTRLVGYQGKLYRLNVISYERC